MWHADILVSTSFHSIFKSRGAENVDFQMWRANLFILVQPEVSTVLRCAFRNPGTFFSLIAEDSRFGILDVSYQLQKGPKWLFFSPPCSFCPGCNTLLLLQTWSRRVRLNRHTGCPLWLGHRSSNVTVALPPAPLAGLCIRESCPFLKRLNHHIPE